MGEDDPLIELSKVAALAGVTEAEVRAWIRTGELAAEPNDGTWAVRKSVVDAAPHRAGPSVRLALNRMRIRTFAEARGERIGSSGRAQSDAWQPATTSLATPAIAALRKQLENLWVPKPQREIRANPTVEWPLLASFTSPITTEKLREIFVPSWSEGTMYALRADGSEWTFPLAFSGTFCALEFGVSLHDDSRPVDGSALERSRAIILGGCQQLGASSVEEAYPLREAIDRARRIESLVACDPGEFQRTLGVLRGDGYSREGAIELLYALGFEAAPASTWAWMNGADCAGEEEIISAALDDSTTINFSFNVARAAEPRRVARTMLSIARAFQLALGGRLTDDFDEEVWLAEVTSAEDRVRAAGLECGGTAMRVL